MLIWFIKHTNWKELSHSLLVGKGSIDRSLEASRHRDISFSTPPNPTLTYSNILPLLMPSDPPGPLPCLRVGPHLASGEFGDMGMPVLLCCVSG